MSASNSNNVLNSASVLEIIEISEVAELILRHKRGQRNELPSRRRIL
jgi:hypothetical protein